MARAWNKLGYVQAATQGPIPSGIDENAEIPPNTNGAEIISTTTTTLLRPTHDEDRIRRTRSWLLKPVGIISFLHFLYIPSVWCYSVIPVSMLPWVSLQQWMVPNPISWTRWDVSIHCHSVNSARWHSSGASHIWHVTYYRFHRPNIFLIIVKAQCQDYLIRYCSKNP